jgi:preprotein translocase subunit SecA
MTATAKAAADELMAVYGLQVFVVPPNRTCIRVDYPDIVFTHKEAKQRAIIEKVIKVHATGRPILVGTLTVKESEQLAARLRKAGVSCSVLNAKRDDQEARIVAQAGKLGAVTISTNMAGRGTDIRLGGPEGAEEDRVVALGGLYVS